MKSWAAMAREASDLTPEDCASAMRCSRNTYLSREENPGKFNIDELRALNTVYNDCGKRLMWEALSELKPYFFV